MCTIAGCQTPSMKGSSSNYYSKMKPMFRSGRGRGPHGREGRSTDLQALSKMSDLRPGIGLSDLKRQLQLPKVWLKCSCFTRLWSFQLYSTDSVLRVHMFILFRFFSHTDYHRILGRGLHAIRQIPVGQSFHVPRWAYANPWPPVHPSPPSPHLSPLVAIRVCFQSLCICFWSAHKDGILFLDSCKWCSVMFIFLGLHFVQSSLGPSVWLQVASFHSF